MNAHADMLTVVSTQRIKHTKGHLSLSCLGVLKFARFLLTKTSANKRLLLCLQTLLGFTPAKLLQFFQLRKSVSKKKPLMRK